MVAIVEEYVDSIIKEVSVTLKLNDWHYNKLNFIDKAQNYFGVIIPINLHGKCNEKAVNFDIILKIAPNDERYRVSGAVTSFFAREIFVYTKVFTEFKELQRDFPLLQCTLPQLFYTCGDYCKEVLVLENMCTKGYTPFLEAMFLDLDHITAGLKSLAHFHSMSIVLKERHPDLFQKIEAICVPLSEKNNKRFIDILINRLSKALVNLEKTSYEPVLSILKTNCAKFVESTFTDVKVLCLCHGDIWKDNLLFKYEEKRPISACLIDFQTARISSPSFDVLYLILSSTDTYLRKNYFYNLLDVYYEIFASVLREAKIDTDKYCRRNFDYDLTVVGPACFIIANTAFWLSNGLQQEGNVRSKQIWTTEEEKLKALNLYKEIIMNLLDDLKSYGYLTAL